jgi:arabinose-5-phosphate isomerase
MRSGEALPRVGPDASFVEMLREMTGKGLGFTAIAGAEDEVLGIFTDGDLRRLLERGADLRELRARDVMHPRPRQVNAGALAVEAAGVMEHNRVTSVLVVDDAQRLVGALNSNDLMRAKVI